MGKLTKMLIVGSAALALFSTPVYAEQSKRVEQSKLVKGEASELRDVILKITGGKFDVETFKKGNFEYRIFLISKNELQLQVYDTSMNKLYKFEDTKVDGILDIYTGSKGDNFTSETTPPEKWSELQKNYTLYTKEVLPLAKKVLNEKYSSLDRDLGDMKRSLGQE